MVHIQPGRPQQNGLVESFHAGFRDERLNVSWFENLWDARRKLAAWREEYNEERPHSSLGYSTPAAFALRLAALRPPTAASEPQFGEQKEEELTGSMIPCAEPGGRSEPVKAEQPITRKAPILATPGIFDRR